MSADYSYGVWPLLGALAGSIWRYRHNLPWLWRQPTDWNAARENLGYEVPPEQPPVYETERPSRWRRWLDWVVGRPDWDARRRQLGYEITLEAKPVRRR